MKKITDKIIKKFKEYLICEEKAKATAEKYIRDLTAFAEWLCGGELSKAKVLEYKKHLIENYAPASVNSVISSQRTIRLKGKNAENPKTDFCPKG